MTGVGQADACRLLFVQVAGFVARTKYYAVWCLAESAFIISGMGWNPRSNDYTASRNVNIRAIEFAGNVRAESSGVR